ncbi:8190_t:CDS:10 [Funneliformis mosseae]|uniref:8190_t:CDS:1 n=1 Tax=Funneliformis mosseae TaxID=27381 RepID=A0A9N8VHP3_FUNMO|nr:8190_t:CDS:10 [Funneliformis mosseae]
MAAYFDFTENKEFENNNKVRVYAKAAVNSCVITGMVTCALKSNERMDIVFAKETVLELLEMTPEGTLISIFEQPVFGTIKDIKVLHSRFPHPMMYDPIDGRVLSENEGNYDNLRRRIPGQDILLCLSDSGMLSFLAYTEYYNDESNSDGTKFDGDYKGKGKAVTGVVNSCVELGKFQVIKEYSLSEPGFDYQQLGSKLCIDPTGRLIAISAWQNNFQLFTVYRGSQLKFDTVNQPKEHQQDIVIWHMSFIHSMDDSRILLAMIVFDEKEQRPNILICQVLVADSPEKYVINYYQLRLDEEDNTFYKVPLPTDGGALMTSFAYPMDESASKRSCLIASHPKQYIYAGFEDGTLYRIEIIDERNILFSLIHKENGLNRIGVCMTVLSVEESEEFIVIGGDMSDGAVVKVLSNMEEVEIASVIPNWAPILDFQMVDFHQERHDVIFSCSGLGKYGSIRELRRAIGVNVVTKAEGEFDGVTSLWGLKNSSEELMDSFLALSFANSTRLMFFGGGELYDISESSGFDLEVYSLCVSNICDVTGMKGVLAQIHRKAVIISEPRIDDSLVGENISFRWIPPEDAVIEVASVYQNMIIICISTINGSAVKVLRVDIEYEMKRVEIVQTAEILLDSQPCFIRCFTPNLIVPIPMCIIGTFKPCVKFLSLDVNGNLLETLHEETLEDYSVTKVNIPESACLIGYNEKFYFLAGLREGTVVYFQFSWSLDNKPILNRPIIRRIGTFPVKFITPQSNSMNESHNNNSIVLALSDRPWQIKHTLHTGLSFSCVAFEHYEHVQEAATFNCDETIRQSYMIISKDCLNFVQLNNLIKNDIRTINIADTPRRLFYDEYNQLFIVACTTDQLPFPTSVLKLVDPSNGEIKCEYKLSECSETIYSITNLSYSTERQEYRWICVGTGIHESSNDATAPLPGHLSSSGRLMIFTIKKSYQESGVIYELNKIKEIKLDGVVYAVCPLTDKYILVGEGRVLNIVKFNLEEKKLMKLISKELRWPIISINSCGNKICVGTQKGSLSFFEFDVEKEKIHFLRTERSARLIGDSIMLNQNLAIGTDKCGNIFGLLYDKESPNIEPCLKPLFSFYEAEIVPRLRIGNLDYRVENLDTNDNNDSTTSTVEETNLDEGQASEGNNVDNDEFGWDADKNLKNSAAIVVGCSLLGSVFLFMRIELKAFRLLNALQIVLEKWPTTKPCLGNNNSTFRLSNNTRHNSSYQPTNLIIDGEMVSQFLRLNKYEQWKVVESDYKLLKIGNEFLSDESEEIKDENFTDRDKETLRLEDEDVEMCAVCSDINYDEVMIIEHNDEHDDVKEEFSDDVKGKIKEIVDALNSMLSELNIQVS